MKTAEKWIDEYRMLGSAGNPKLIKQIQLDAMKEGMRRAADKAADCFLGMSAATIAVGARSPTACEINQAILTAAEQLTEKDLTK